MNELELQYARLQSAIQQCDIHLQRLESARARLNPVLPLTLEKYRSLPEDTVTLIDQLVYRFIQLQDTIGTKIVPEIYLLISGAETPAPFLDQLNTLEKSSALTSVNKWLELRTLRNQLTHEYPDQPELYSAVLSTLFSAIPEITGIYRCIRKYCTDHLINNKV